MRPGARGTLGDLIEVVTAKDDRGIGQRSDNVCHARVDQVIGIEDFICQVILRFRDNLINSHIFEMRELSTPFGSTGNLVAKDNQLAWSHLGVPQDVRKTSL